MVVRIVKLLPFAQCVKTKTTLYLMNNLEIVNAKLVTFLMIVPIQNVYHATQLCLGVHNVLLTPYVMIATTLEIMLWIYLQATVNVNYSISKLKINA